MVVLYRTNAQSRLFEIALTQKKVPYTIVGSQNFYQRKEVKDLIAYLNVMLNPADNESLIRIINEPPRGIGQTTVGRLLSHAADARITMSQAVQNVYSLPNINSGLQAKVNEFAEMMQGYTKRVGKEQVTELVKELVEELGLISQYRKSSDPKEIARAENLIEFVASVSEFAERFSEENQRAALLADFMPHVALQTDLDRADSEQESIMLMTLHNAKGLEFDTVYIAGMEDELLPHRMSMETREEIEEERRLFYVGITRAKRRLVLSLAQTRRLYDAFMVTRPSLFLRGLDTSVLDAHTAIPQRAPSAYKKPKSKLRDSQKHYKIGQKVWHDEYQDGVILAVNGMDEDAIVTVSFKSGKLIKVVGRFLKTEL
jgi:DNA helicase-2/ATP-dependent DNA helicase PcrA